MKFYRSPFLRDFWHLNVAMMTSNNALIPDPDKEDILASVPTDWPLMRLGLRMCAWVNMQTKYYLIGTPIIWWGTTASLFVSVVAFCTYVFRVQRRYVDMEPSTCRAFKRNLYFCPFFESSMFAICTQENGSTFYMWARSRYLAGYCTSVCV
jgi:dolichyl-phosphate-mannose--protein O-mannosyl transferase